MEESDSREPMEEASKGKGLSSRTQTLDGEDAKTVDALVDSATGDCNTDNSVSDEKQVEVDVEDNVEKTISSDDDGESEGIEGEEENVISTGGKEVTDEDNGDACDAEQSLVNGEMISAAENEAELEKESIENSGEEDNEMGVDSEQAEEEIDGHDEQGNPGYETTDAKHSESALVPEESTQLSKGEGEAMEVDYAAEEEVEKDVEVGGALDNAGNKSNGASVVQSQDGPIAETDGNDASVVKEMEIDERKGNADMANPKSPTEDAATGNIQDLKTETGNVSLKDDKKATDMAEEVATVDATLNAESHDNLSLSAEGTENESSVAATECPREASDAIMGSDENQEDKETIDQQVAMREEDEITHEAPKEDTEMEEIPNSSDFADDGTDSDIKTNGVKRKADVLSEDSAGEGRKTVSLAKVSFAQTPSFKIGASIARAASQMAGAPSVLKGSNIGDKNLSVESFVSQLHCAATDPVKENVVSDLATDFFLDFRNSLAVTPEKVSKKRGRPSNSNAGGTEAFEFEEMGDTYWTDRVIHNGGEEQTPPTEKGNYQVVPVELKPSQVKKTRRPYRRRQSQISTPLPSASDKPADFDENAPAELIMKFSETDSIPPEKSLSKMFRHFGPIRESQTEVDEENNRARVVYRKGTDAQVAYNSAGRFSIFGTKAVNYELSYTITEAFKVHPYVVSLGEEDAALTLPS